MSSEIAAQNYFRESEFKKKKKRIASGTGTVEFHAEDSHFSPGLATISFRILGNLHNVSELQFFTCKVRLVMKFK